MPTVTPDSGNADGGRTMTIKHNSNVYLKSDCQDVAVRVRRISVSGNDSEPGDRYLDVYDTAGGCRSIAKDSIPCEEIGSSTERM